MFQEMGANPLFTKPKCCVSVTGSPDLTVPIVC